jgi:hypothetical protein
MSGRNSSCSSVFFGCHRKPTGLEAVTDAIKQHDVNWRTIRLSATYRGMPPRGRRVTRAIGCGRCPRTSLNRKPPLRVHLSWAGGPQPHYALKPLAIGKIRTRFLVAAARAFATAGPIGGTPGLPTPEGCSIEGTICSGVRRAALSSEGPQVALRKLLVVQN